MVAAALCLRRQCRGRDSGVGTSYLLGQCRTLFFVIVSLTWLLQALIGQVVGQLSPVPTLDSCEKDEQTLEILVNRTKAEVAQIAQRALDNEYDCGLLQSCVVSRPPAVLACTGVTPQADNLTCVRTVTQPNVTQCYGQACYDEYLGYNIGSTQLPPGTNVGRTTGVISSTKDYKAAICKKNFQDLFQKMVVYNRTSTFGNWRYYADILGIFHKFPFQAITQVVQSTPSDTMMQCRPYDPRRRPWYTGAISSAKSVFILIDVGATNAASSSSISGIGGLPSETVVSRLQVAKEAAATFMDTLTENDAVGAASFDIRVNLLGPTGAPMVPVTSYDHPHAELAALNASIYNLTTTPYSSSGLSAAIDVGLQVLSNSTAGCQKILIVLTDAQGFGGTFNRTALNITINTAIADQNRPITIFFVSIGQADTVGDIDLKNLACSTQGVWMRVSNTDNILFDAYPYFNFLARTSQYVNAQYLSAFYVDFSGLGPVFTVAQPVFDNRTGDFLGVAAGDTSFSLLSELCAETLDAFLEGLRAVQAPCPANNTITSFSPCLIAAVRGVNNTDIHKCPAPSSCNLPIVGPACDLPPIPKNVFRPPGPAVSPLNNYCCGSCSVTSPPGA